MGNAPPGNGTTREEDVGGINGPPYNTNNTTNTNTTANNNNNNDSNQHPRQQHQHHPSDQPYSHQHYQQQQQQQNYTNNPYAGVGPVGGGPGGGHNSHSPAVGYMNTHSIQQQHNQHNQRNMHESKSDASMSNVDPTNNNPNNNHSNNNNNNNNPNNNNANKQSQQQITLASLAAADDDTVPTVFRWEHGGRQVYITGTFNGWSRQIPMHRSGNDFTYIHNLKRGKHAFKFIVDDEWRFAPDQPTVADIEGRINNFIDVTDFKAYTGDKDFEREKAAAYYSQPRNGNNDVSGAGVGGVGGADDNDGNGPDNADNNPNTPGSNSTPGNVSTPGSSNKANAPDTFTDPDGETFTLNMPDLDDYTKDPPPLPPHLRHIILNKPPQLSDTAALPVPQHVALNHLYCTAIKDNMMVLGITQRFRTKFVTTVYYSPELSK